MSKNQQQNTAQKDSGNANAQNSSAQGIAGIPPVVDAAAADKSAVQSGNSTNQNQSTGNATTDQSRTTPVAAAQAPVATVVLAPTTLAVTGNGLTGVVAGHIEFVEMYCEAMNPKKSMSAAEAARHQVGLYRTIVNILNNSGEQFSKAYATLLKLFNTHKDGALGTRAVYRAADVVPLNADERATFHALLDLLILTADPQSRKTALRQVDLNKTFRTKNLNEQTKQRVMNFYNL